MIRIKYTPFPAVRSNRNSWSKRTKDYHSKMNDLRLLTNWSKQEIIDSLLWECMLEFIIPIPKSWSNKKKWLMMWKPHTQTPDIDNLFKWFTDTVFYNTDYNDSAINWINCRKIWGIEWEIIIYN